MKLLISADASDNTDVMVIKPAWLSDKGVHLFIASNHWDELEVRMDELIPEGVLKYVIQKCTKRRAVLEGVPTQHIINLLCEMFPENSGHIRKESMLGRDISKYLEYGGDIHD